MPERKMNPPVFLGSSAIIAALLILGIAVPGQAEDLFSAVQSWIIDTFGWLYILSVAGFVFAVLFLELSRYAWPALWTTARLGVVSPPMNSAIPTRPSLPTTAISAAERRSRARCRVVAPSASRSAPTV